MMEGHRAVKITCESDHPQERAPFHQNVREQGYKLNKQCNGAMCVFCLRTFCQQTTRCAKIGPKLKNVVEPFFPHRFFPKSFEQQIPNVEDDQIKKLIYLEPRVFLLLKCLQLFQILNQ